MNSALWDTMDHSLGKQSFQFAFPNTVSCLNSLSAHYPLITLETHILVYQGWVSLGFLEHFHVATLVSDTPKSLYWMKMYLLSTRSMFNSPVNISRWISYTFPEIHTCKIKFDTFSLLGSTVLLIVEPVTLRLSLLFASSFFSIYTTSSSVISCLFCCLNTSKNHPFLSGSCVTILI